MTYFDAPDLVFALNERAVLFEHVCSNTRIHTTQLRRSPWGIDLAEADQLLTVFLEAKIALICIQRVQFKVLTISLFLNRQRPEGRFTRSSTPHSAGSDASRLFHNIAN